MPHPSEQIYSILLVGVGGMGRVWLSELCGLAPALIGVRLVALCDVDTERATAALADEGVDLAAFGSITDALETRPDIVIDCTTANARIAIVGEALKHGAHVLCEKPLAATETDAGRLLGMAARAPGHLAVSQNRRFHSGVRQLRALVTEQRLGTPQRLTATLHMAPRFGGFREQMQSVMLRDMAIHAFDAARAILGQDAVSVTCIEKQVTGSRFAHGGDALAIFEMSGGTQFCFDGSWTDIGPQTSWNGSWRLAFSGGSARWDGETDVAAFLPAPLDTTDLLPAPLPCPVAADDGGPNDIMGALASLVSALRQGRAPETNARDNSRSLAMVLAAVRSAAADGRKEAVRDLALNGDSGDFLSERRHRHKQAEMD